MRLHCSCEELKNDSLQYLWWSWSEWCLLLYLHNHLIQCWSHLSWGQTPLPAASPGEIESERGWDLKNATLQPALFFMKWANSVSSTHAQTSCKLIGLLIKIMYDNNNFLTTCKNNASEKCMSFLDVFKETKSQSLQNNYSTKKQQFSIWTNSH